MTAPQNINSQTVPIQAGPGQVTPTQVAPGTQGIPSAANQAMDPKQALLSQLNDVVAPDPISWWPLAPGWWILCIVFLAVSLFLFLKIRTNSRNNRYRKQAILEITKIS